jgi:hypothetical protein
LIKNTDGPFSAPESLGVDIEIEVSAADEGREILQDEAASDHDCAWKERARKHGCDVDNGDPDCG